MSRSPAPMNPASTNHGPVDYGLSPALRARLMGLTLVLVGLLICAVTVVVALLRLPLDVISVLVLVVLLVVAGLGYVLNRRAWVLRVDDQGYQVRLVRGAGVRQARWGDVEDMATAEVAGSRCLVLRLREGTSTTIPVDALTGDPEQLVRDLRSRLGRSAKNRRPRT